MFIKYINWVQLVGIKIYKYLQILYQSMHLTISITNRLTHWSMKFIWSIWSQFRKTKRQLWTYIENIDLLLCTATNPVCSALCELLWYELQALRDKLVYKQCIRNGFVFENFKLRFFFVKRSTTLGKTSRFIGVSRHIGWKPRGPNG